MVQIVQTRPYPIAEVRMLPDTAFSPVGDAVDDGADADENKQPDEEEQPDEDLGKMEEDIRSACADLFFRAIEVNTERILLPPELQRMIGGVSREAILAEPLDVLAAFVLRNAPNASLDFLCSSSRAERLSIMSRGLEASKEAVELGFDYTYKQQWAAIGARIQLFIVIATFSFITLSLAANQGIGLDAPSPF